MEEDNLVPNNPNYKIEVQDIDRLSTSIAAISTITR
jgi:hypothetical protein